jgi:hypothetical protein
MEFQGWYDLQLSAIVAMFAKSMEELGLHSQKSQPLLANGNIEPRLEASKSLGLGDLLTFMQKHFNQILQYKNPAYKFEFVGYEKDDVRLVSEIDKSEVDTWKTLNEKRAEKGVEPIDLTKVKNPADLPMNVQAVQLWQSQQSMGGDSFDMGDEDGFEEGEGEDEEEGGGEAQGTEGTGNEGGGTEAKGKSGDGGWDDIEEQHGSVNKSLGGAVRIVI